MNGEIWSKLLLLDMDAQGLRSQVNNGVSLQTPYKPRDLNKLDDIIKHLQGSLDRAMEIK